MKLIRYIGLVLSLLLLITSVNAWYTGTAYYEFENNWLDTGSGGNSNTLTPTNSPTFVTAPVIVNPYSARFVTASSQYSQDTSFVAGNQVRSIDIWVRVNTTGTVQSVISLSNASLINQDRFELLVRATGNTTHDYQLVWVHNGLNVLTPSFPFVRINNVANTWKKITIVFNDGGTFKIYENGVTTPVYSFATATQPSINYNRLRLATTQNLDSFYGGYQSNLFITNRLYTTTNITQSFRGGLGCNYNDNPTCSSSPYLQFSSINISNIPIVNNTYYNTTQLDFETFVTAYNGADDTTINQTFYLYNINNTLINQTMYSITNTTTTIINVWTDLSGTDTGNWVGTDDIRHLATNPNKNIVYTGIANGKLGIYNRTTNVWTDLSGTDTGNWVGTDTVNTIAVNTNNNLMYSGLGNGKFGVYNRATNVWTDLSGTDTGNWVGTSLFQSLSVLPNKNLVYTGLAVTGKFGVYNSTSNVLTDLSATDTGGWASNFNVNAVVVNQNKNVVYTGIANGLLGIYNRSTNVWTDLSATDPGDWVGVIATNGIAYNTNNNLVYTAMSAGKLGVYNRATNVWTDLSGTDTGNWVGTDTVLSITVNSAKNLVYTGIANGKFGVYNSTSNVWTDLSGTDTGNWVGTSAIRGVSINPLDNYRVYTGLAGGKLGNYLLSISATEHINPAIFTLYNLLQGKYYIKFSAINEDSIFTETERYTFFIDIAPPSIIDNIPNEIFNYEFNGSWFYCSDIVGIASCNISIDGFNKSNATDFTLHHNGNLSYLITAEDNSGNINTSSGFLFVNPLQRFNFIDQDSNPVYNFTFGGIFYNGSYAQFPLYDLGLGTHTLAFQKGGFNEANITFTFNTTSDFNVTIQVNYAIINVSIYDRITGLPLLANVTVTILGVTSGTTTTGNIVFSGAHLPSGTYFIQASAVGYFPEQRSFIYNGETNVDISFFLLNVTSPNIATLIIQVLDEFDNLIPDTEVNLYEYDPLTGSNTPVGQCISNTNGECQFYVEMYVKYYNYDGTKEIGGNEYFDRSPEPEQFLPVIVDGEIIIEGALIRNLHLQLTANELLVNFESLQITAPSDEDNATTFLNQTIRIIEVPVTFSSNNNQDYTVCVNYYLIQPNGGIAPVIAPMCVTGPSGTISEVPVTLDRDNTYKVQITVTSADDRTIVFRTYDFLSSIDWRQYIATNLSLQPIFAWLWAIVLAMSIATNTLAIWLGLSTLLAISQISQFSNFIVVSASVLIILINWGILYMSKKESDTL